MALERHARTEQKQTNVLPEYPEVKKRKKNPFDEVSHSLQMFLYNSYYVTDEVAP